MLKNAALGEMLHIIALREKGRRMPLLLGRKQHAAELAAALDMMQLLTAMLLTGEDVPETALVPLADYVKPRVGEVFPEAPPLLPLTATPLTEGERNVLARLDTLLDEAKALLSTGKRGDDGRLNALLSAIAVLPRAFLVQGEQTPFAMMAQPLSPAEALQTAEGFLKF